MLNCKVCGKKADIHHIVHKRKGGFEFPLNYIYLCNYHHRGPLGPHKNLLTDLKYKLELQEKLYTLLPKDFYSAKSLTIILGIKGNPLKRLISKMKLYKEGYSKKDIVFNLMGKKYYTNEMLEDLELEMLIEKYV